MGSRHSRPSDPPEAVPSVTPGRWLHQGREALHLSQEEIAHTLRLSLQMVKAIETDRYEGLNSTYLRGYIRSYARLVGINPDSVVELYNEIAVEPPPIAPCGSASAPQASSGDKLVKGVTYAIVAVLGVSMLTWWQTREADEPEPAAPLASEADPAEARLLPAPPGTAIPEEAPPVEEPAGQPPLAPATEGLASPEPRELEPPPAPPGPPAEQPPPAVIEPAAHIPAPELAAARAGARILAMDLNEDCWIEVVDGKRQRLYYDIARGGQNLKLAGDPPFSVRLGRAEAVTLSYDGQAVDFSPIARTGVARFKVGEDGVYR